MEIIKDLWGDGLVGRSLLLFIVCAVILIPLSIYGSIEEAKQWSEFKSSHNCKIVGKEKGHLQTGVGPVMSGSGGVAVIITSTPDKVGYLCDDGVTYWR